MANSASKRTKLENFLAYMVAGLIGLSIISIIAIPLITVFISKAALVPILVVFPWIGLPLAALCIIAILILQIRNKSK